MFKQAHVAWDANENVLRDVDLHKDKELVEGAKNVADWA
jgi:hypothetical protein